MGAGRIKGLTIEIGGDTTKLVKALASVDNSIAKTQQNLRDINKALKFDPTNVNLITDKQKELATQIDATKQKLETEKEALSQMKNTEGFDANSQAARDLQIQIDLDTAALKELESQARQSSSVLGTQMQAAGEKIKQVGDSIKAVGDKITGIGQSLTTKVTMPIVGAFGASAKAAIDWESAFTGVRKTVDATDEEFAQLADNIQKMATETASSANEIAGVMEIAGQLGIEGVDGLTTFTKTMVELGDTTNLSAEEAATALARFLNITGESTTDVDKIGAAVVDLGNNFATTESEIVTMATRLASAGTIAGLTSTDILALATAMSSVGIKAEAGGTAMSQTLKTISTSVAYFKEGEAEDLEVIANVAQMSAEKFAEAWESDPVTALQAFIQGLAQVKEEGGNVFSTLGEMGMEGIRQTNMLQALALASDMLGDAVKTSTEAYKENIALTEEANKRYETMAAKMSQLKARITQVAIEIGEMLMPYIEKAMDFIEGLVEKWKALDDEQQESILKFAAIAAAIGPVLVVIGTLISSIGSIVSAGGSLISGIGTLLTKLGGLSGVLSALASPIGIVVAAIAALAAGFLYLYTTNEDFRKSIKETVEKLKENFGRILEIVKPQLDALGEAFKGLMDLLAPVFEFIFTYAVAVINGVLEAIGPLIEFVTNTIEFFTSLIQAFIALVQGDTDAFTQYITSALINFLNAITSLFSANVNFILGFFRTFGVDLKQVFTTMWTNIKTAIQTKIEEIKQFIEETWTAIKEWITETITAIKEKFEEIFEKIKEAVSEKIEQAKEAIITGMEEAADYIKSLPDKFFQWGEEMVQKLIDGIKSKIEAVKQAASDLASAISSYIHFSVPDVGPLHDIDSFMPDMVDELVRGIYRSMPRLENAMNSMAGGMASQLQLSGSTGISGPTTNNININVYGAQGQDPNALVDIIEERLAENMTRRGVAFG